MLSNFVAYQLSLQLYRQCEALMARAHVRDQLSRASLSVVLNLAEGSGKSSPADRRRFYSIALGSLRETQALLEVLGARDAAPLANRLDGRVYRLAHPRPPAA